MAHPSHQTYVCYESNHYRKKLSSVNPPEKLDLNEGSESENFILTYKLSTGKLSVEFKNFER